jgi:hypothetical protein
LPKIDEAQPPVAQYWASAIAAAPAASLEELGIDLKTHEPAPTSPVAALQLVRRAVAAVRAADPLPPWLLQLSELLSVACQRQGDYEVAGRILSVVCSRGPLPLDAFVAHKPTDIIQKLTSKEELFGLKRNALESQLCLSAELLSADVEGVSAWRAEPMQAAAARKVLGQLLKYGMEDTALSTFRQLRAQHHLGMNASIAFIEQLSELSYLSQAIDAFVDLAESVGTAEESTITGEVPQSLCESIFQALKATHGHSVLDALGAMKKLQGASDPNLAARWIPDILQAYWKKSRHLNRTVLLHAHMLRYMTSSSAKGARRQGLYRLSSTLVRILLDAGDLQQAETEWQKLQSSYPRAAEDMDVPAGFARYHARVGEWGSVRSEFERMSHLRDANPQLRTATYDIAFRSVLDEFMRTHTWSECRRFVEEYVQDFKVPIHLGTVNKLVQWHGKCRDYKGIRTWLLFCEGHGFELRSSFLDTLFTDAKETWRYNPTQLVALYRELEGCMRGGEEDRARLKSLVKDAACQSGVEPAKETTLLKQMDSAVRRQRWSGVLKIYQATSRDREDWAGGRYLQLAVQSCIKLGLEEEAFRYVQQARADGHDVREASTTLCLAELDRIEADVRQKGVTRSGGRSSPYDAIQRLFQRVQGSMSRIDNVVFSKAAQVCLSLRSYREAVSVCVTAAQTNGREDLCYNVDNFANLSQAFVARHDYDKLRWLLERVQHKHYRAGRHCRRSLSRTAHYLKVALQQDKAEELKALDRAMLECVEQVTQAIEKERESLQSDMDDLMSEPESMAADDERVFG